MPEATPGESWDVTPSTSDILNLLVQMHDDGLLPPLKSFSLTYGSLWEANATFKEEDTFVGLVKFLDKLGVKMEYLKVQNYSHQSCTLLQVRESLAST